MTTTQDYPAYAALLRTQALEQGAANAVLCRPSEFVFDPRTILKCMFGCKDWGKGHTCPSRPNNLSLEQYRDIIERYQWGLLIHAHDKATTQRISLALEGQAFRDGYYFAFSFSDCAICPTCAGHQDAPCRAPDKARPALHSVGIDLFKTVERFGLPLYTLSTHDQVQNWYAAVLVE